MGRQKENIDSKPVRSHSNGTATHSISLFSLGGTSTVCCTGKVEILRDHLNVSESEFRHEFLVGIVQDEFKDQTLESFGNIFRVVSRFGIVEPMSINNKNRGKALEQRI